MNPLKAAEKLFFAVFGQARNSDMMAESPGRFPYRPDWTKSLFKIVFGTYMLVTVVVLVKLLIATMSDTYQQIQAQSDIEWKFGLSKLIRSIDRSTTAPSPINLITTWLFYLADVCKARVRKSQRMSPRTKAGTKWFSKIRKRNEVARRTSIAVSSMMQLSNSLDVPTSVAPKIVTIEHVTDWEAIANKYRVLTGRMDEVSGETEKNGNRSDEDSEVKRSMNIYYVYRLYSFWSPFINLEFNWWVIFLAKTNPINVFDMFLAVFGQTTTRSSCWNPFPAQHGPRFFANSYSECMLVSVVVFVKLLTAKMYDTYQRIQMLFFAVFGQASTQQLQAKDHPQSQWTEVLFKIVFGLYMLVTVVVLINLLIAMMTDTYQRIQAQSDIEWKYGLSKLIRNMHRTSSAPSPINLITTWLFYLIHEYREREKKLRKRPDMISVLNTLQGKRTSPKLKAGMKWLSKIKKMAEEPETPIESPFGSQLELSVKVTRIENVDDWERVARRYRVYMGYTTTEDAGYNINDSVENFRRTNPRLQLPSTLVTYL